MPVATTVHPLQLLDDFPVEAHDLPVSLIVTPEGTIEAPNPLPAPEGIDWDKLPEKALAEMPVLAQLRRCRLARSAVRVLDLDQDGRTVSHDAEGGNE
ncbi:MAG: hypothetical protein KatS3mg123_2421 [Burkholderiales bacterium]|nr:MAG: hypothetical protein KatS3mg123_2421 [Burkholderiales bacterium]